jgi:uncharacterized membrane protein
MIKTTALGNGICMLGLLVLLVGCASQYKKQEEAAKKMPVNCATAEGDIRTLQSEKASVAQQAAMGVTAIAPIGLVVGLVGGTEGTKVKVATGEYNKALDSKIAEIKSTCSIP